MQEQVYLTDTYTLSLESRILNIRGSNGSRWVCLEKNPFHPKGGGQPSDVGSVNGIDVLEMKKDEGGMVFLLLATDSDLPEIVRAEVNAAKRKKFAALHTTGHMVNAVLCGQGFKYQSCNHEPGKARVVFVCDRDVDRENLKKHLEREITMLIKKDIEVRERTSSEYIREIYIGDLIRDRCAGTHVKSTGMIFDFTIRSLKHKKGLLSVGYDSSHV